MRNIRIGILGSGDVGRALATGFAALGHEVKIGTRDPEKLRDWAASSAANISISSFGEAAQFGDVVILATLGVATEAAIRLAGIGSFDGKVVIDTTNPLDFSKGMPPTLSIGTTDSLGESIQRLLPKARVVKAFNTVGNALMVNPDLPGGPPDMFLCGNDADAKELVSQICKHFGWGVVDLGGIDAARYLEPMCVAWVLYGLRSGTWKHAFKLLRS